MNYMFFNCLNLISLDLSHFNTSSVINMESMFSSCSSLISLDLSHFITSSVTNMNEMFLYCNNLILCINSSNSQISDMIPNS